MDRRTFLKTTLSTTGVAAAGGSVAVSPALARPNPEPIARAASVSIEAHVSGAFEMPYLKDVAEQFSRRVFEVSDGQLRIQIQDATSQGPHVGSSDKGVLGGAEASFSVGSELVAVHPAFGYFSGLPLDLGLSSQLFMTWLTAVGGQMLWDDLAGLHGFKPILIGHSGATGGGWVRRDLVSAPDLRGLKVSVSGLGGKVAEALGGAVVEMAVDQQASGLREGALAFAELPVPLTIAVSSGFGGEQVGWVHERLGGQGAMLAFNIDRTVWDKLSLADQAVIEACGRESAIVLTAEQAAHHGMVAPHLMAASGVSVSKLPSTLMQAARKVAREIVGDVAAFDMTAARVHDAYTEFQRRMAGLDEPAGLPNLVG